jgi:hypothetical protein
MNVKDKAGAMTQMAKGRLREAKLDNARDRNERLRTKNDQLREELSRTRAEHEKLLDAFERVRKPRPRRLRRVFVLSAAAGTAYVMGAKAGRERYEQIRRWFDEMRNRPEMQRFQEQARERVSGASEGMQRIGERAASTIQDTGARAASTIERTSESTAEKTQEASRKASEKSTPGSDTPSASPTRPPSGSPGSTPTTSTGT